MTSDVSKSRTIEHFLMNLNGLCRLAVSYHAQLLAHRQEFGHLTVNSLTASKYASSVSLQRLYIYLEHLCTLRHP